MDSLTRNAKTNRAAFISIGLVAAAVFAVFIFGFTFVIPPNSGSLQPIANRIANQQPSIPQPSIENNARMGNPRVEVRTENHSGVFKCLNEGHVTYSASPCASDSSAVAYQDNLVNISQAPDKHFHSVSLIRGGNGVYNLSGKVNSIPADFIIDTGASSTTISGSTAHQMGVRSCTITGTVSTANGIAGNCSMVVARLSFGDFVFTNVQVNIAPTMQGNSLIGNDLLSALKVEQHGGVMTLSK